MLLLLLLLRRCCLGFCLAAPANLLQRTVHTTALFSAPPQRRPPRPTVAPPHPFHASNLSSAPCLTLAAGAGALLAGEPAPSEGKSGRAGRGREWADPVAASLRFFDKVPARVCAGKRVGEY